ncbi:MAG: cyclic pyranopterin monophosphate synthase MoaC [Chloroflexi bacterium]|nr:cyclic pyranopterin monophosphate synthase MoaC [Chloroflexota bacterium]
MGEKNRVRMIDVGPKPDSHRESVARGRMKMKPATLKMVRQGRLPKGDCLAAAQVAGIMAAKRTPDLIPLCHPLLLNDVRVEYAFDDDGLEITASVRTVGKTGVEMEALTAVAVAALTIYDMCKGVDPAVRIENIRLVSKRGGKSGQVVLE